MASCMWAFSNREPFQLAEHTPFTGACCTHVGGQLLLTAPLPANLANVCYLVGAKLKHWVSVRTTMIVVMIVVMRLIGVWVDLRLYGLWVHVHFMFLFAQVRPVPLNISRPGVQGSVPFMPAIPLMPHIFCAPFIPDKVCKPWVHSYVPPARVMVSKLIICEHAAASINSSVTHCWLLNNLQTLLS